MLQRGCCFLVTKSVTVSVNMQKYGGLCTKPIGKVSSIAIKLPCSLLEGITTANANAAVGVVGTL
jgi:hypothetical protein